MAQEVKTVNKTKGKMIGNHILDVFYILQSVISQEVKITLKPEKEKNKQKTQNFGKVIQELPSIFY